MSALSIVFGAVILVLLAGVFAMTDAALTRISPTRAAELVREHKRGAKALVAVARSLPHHVSLLLLLRIACELTATVLVTFVAVDRWGLGVLAALAAAGGMTIVSFVVIGVGPRTVGQQHPYGVALAMAGPTRSLGRVLGPLARLLTIIGNAVTPGRGYREGPFATEVELRDLLDLAEQRGDVEHEERDMIHSVFELGDTMVREVMVPRTDVVWIERDKSVRQALALALRSGFSRIPVIGESVDDVRGVIYLKDLVKTVYSGQYDRALTAAAGKQRVDHVMREAEFVPEFKPVDELLREMQARRIHIAVVVDEYGGTAGLVTIEDLVEEIVGEITDEYDHERPPIEPVSTDDDSTAYRVTARLSVADLAELFHVDVPAEDVETVGGLMAQALGKVPIPGTTVAVNGLTLTAESAGGRRNRIDTVLARQM